MELRVWVDGTQRVVCGVKLTTTCQEIVFALAHATQQAGRFTMIERWRNNERLLSPNEQPLVTLQRWADRMNEVEFILRKTSSDPPPPQPPSQTNPQQQAVNNLIASQHQQQLSPKQQQQDLTRTNNDMNNKSTQQQQQIQPSQPLNTGPASNNPIASTSSSQQLLNDQTYDNIYRHRQPTYNLDPAMRRSQTMLAPMTNSTSATSLGPASYLSNNNSHHALNHRLSANFRPSLSASTLPNTNTTNNMMAASPSNSTSIARSRYTNDDQLMMNNSPSMSNNLHNGYSTRNESQFHQQSKQLNNQVNPDQAPPLNAAPTNNHHLEDLYSTINKRRFNQPPAVPAKPRVMNPIGNVPITQNVYNAQMNYYHPNQSPASLCSNNNIRPRHPPGYLDYMEAIANRNSLPQPINPNHMNHQLQHHQNIQSNMFLPRSYEPHSNFGYKQNNSSPNNSSTQSNKYGHPTNGQVLSTNNGQNLDLSSSSSRNFSSPINSRLLESGIVINRGSAVNIKLASNSQIVTNHQNRSKIDERLNTSTHSNSSSVSQIGHDMLKVIEEQKKLLMKQKNELDKLDIDQEYWDAQQNSEQTELINRIESEIRQLEELWKENQTQINKLENQDFAGLLEKLKAEQIKMEDDIEVQRIKLAQCENDIVQCNIRIELLEDELINQDIDLSDSEIVEPHSDGAEPSTEKKKSDLEQNHDLPARPNYSNGFGEQQQIKSIANGCGGKEDDNGRNGKDEDEAEEEEEDDSSGGESSDDPNSNNSKLRSAKDVAYVEKRGLISGIRSLKLDHKSRSITFPCANVKQFCGPELRQNIQRIESFDALETTPT